MCLAAVKRILNILVYSQFHPNLLNEICVQGISVPHTSFNEAHWDSQAKRLPKLLALLHGAIAQRAAVDRCRLLTLR